MEKTIDALTQAQRNKANLEYSNLVKEATLANRSLQLIRAKELLQKAISTVENYSNTIDKPDAALDIDEGGQQAKNLLVQVNTKLQLAPACDSLLRLAVDFKQKKSYLDAQDHYEQALEQCKNYDEAGIQKRLASTTQEGFSYYYNLGMEYYPYKESETSKKTAILGFKNALKIGGYNTAQRREIKQKIQELEALLR